MPDMNLLSQKIEDSGMPITVISDRAGITRATLYNRLKGKGEWKVCEITEMSKVLRLNKRERDEIFLS